MPGAAKQRVTSDTSAQFAYLAFFPSKRRHERGAVPHRKTKRQYTKSGELHARAEQNMRAKFKKSRNVQMSGCSNAAERQICMQRHASALPSAPTHLRIVGTSSGTP